jgi:hypothetical protein
MSRRLLLQTGMPIEYQSQRQALGLLLLRDQETAVF